MAGTDKVRWDLFGIALQHARLGTAELGEKTQVSESLILKVQQRQRRATDDTLDGIGSYLHMRGRQLIHDGRILQALVTTEATHYVDLIVNPWSRIALAVGDTESFFGRSSDDLAMKGLDALFAEPPRLKDSDEPQSVTARREDDSVGGVNFGTAVVSQSPGEHGHHDWFVTILFRSE